MAKDLEFFVRKEKDYPPCVHVFLDHQEMLEFLIPPEPPVSIEDIPASENGMDEINISILKLCILQKLNKVENGLSGWESCINLWNEKNPSLPYRIVKENGITCALID